MAQVAGKNEDSGEFPDLYRRGKWRIAKARTMDLGEQFMDGICVKRTHPNWACLPIHRTLKLNGQAAFCKTALCGFDSHLRFLLCKD